MIIYHKKFCFSVLLLILFLWVPLSRGEPNVHQVNVDGKEVIVKGEFFGSKESPYPILWAFGSDIRENGKVAQKEVGVVANDSVLVGDSGLAVWSRGQGVTYDNLSRLPEVSHTYRAENDGWLGWPLAFGGDDTPFSDKAYVSWRVKAPGDISKYVLVAVSDLGGEFNLGADQFTPGENVEIVPVGAQQRTGRIVHFDSERRQVHLEVSGLSSKHFSGAKVLGLDSGATAVLDSERYYRSSSSSKFFRSHETISGAGTRFVVSTNRLITVQFDSRGKEIQRAFEFEGDSGYGLPAITENPDWNLVEVFIDLSGKYGEGIITVNGNESKTFSGLDISETKPKDAGPTVANIGWEAAGGVEEINVALNFGEIYFDKTPQRAVLTNSKVLKDARSNVEVQYSSYWSDNEVRFESQFGGLNDAIPIYLFIFDENNESNSAGFCVYMCEKDELPPSRIMLNVE
ncbi:hypothetical protein [Methylophaga sp.]|uniref:hypothetical protein n=1 Tax=Methylophaga sp. TaxID=2024840 RepID=UPI003A9363A9